MKSNEVTVQQVKKCLTSFGVKDKELINTFEEHLDKFIGLGLNSPTRLANFLAQLTHESANFTRTRESLYYRSAKRIQAVYRKKRFPTLASAEPYVRSQKALANKVYNGRLGNSPNTDDGWDYRGRGLLQLTGKSNYRIYGGLVGVDLVRYPSLAETHLISLLVACHYFSRVTYKGKNVWYYCDVGDVSGVSKLINGGTNGLADRKVKTNKLKDLLGVSGSTTKVGTQKTRPAKPTVLRKGSRGEAVKTLQLRLKELGYVITVDGIYGKGTVRIIKQFQRDNKLTVDGIAGKDVFSKL